MHHTIAEAGIEELEKARSSSSGAGLEALIKAEEEKLVEREKKKDEKRQRLEEAKAKALK